jgi:O-antigen/teichoic acid export membrane protein
MPRPGRSAAHGTAILMAGQIGLMLSGYVIAVLLARSLGPALYGAYGIVYSVLLSVELIGRLGMPQALSKLIAEQDESAGHLEATGFTLALIIYAAIFLGFWLAAPWLGGLFNVADGGYLFRVAAIDIPFYGVYFMLVHILNGRRAFAQQGATVILYSLTRTVGIIVLVLIGPSVAGALIVNVIGSTVALGLAALWVGRRPFRLTFGAVRPVVRLAIPVAIIALGTQSLVSVDLWALNALGSQVPDTVKGYYVAASSVARVPTVVAFIMTSVLVPSVARALAGGRPQDAVAVVENALRFMALTLIPGCALIALEARGILALLFSSAYGAGAPLLSLLIFAQGLFYTLFMAFSSVLIAAGRQHASAFIAVVMVGVAVVTSATGVWLLGAPGAALGALAATSVAAAISTLLVFRTLRPRFDLVALCKLLLATALICLVATAVPSDGLLLLAELAALAVLFLVLVLVLRVIALAELEPFLPKPLKRLALRRSA